MSNHYRETRNEIVGFDKQVLSHTMLKKNIVFHYPEPAPPPPKRFKEIVIITPWPDIPPLDMDKVRKQKIKDKIMDDKMHRLANVSRIKARIGLDQKKKPIKNKVTMTLRSKIKNKLSFKVSFLHLSIAL
jgi:hypothetical protein